MAKTRRRSCNTTNAARFLVFGLVLATASCVLASDEIDDESTAADIVVDVPIPKPASAAAEVPIAQDISEDATLKEANWAYQTALKTLHNLTLTEQHERTPSTATSVLRSVPRGVPSSSISTLLRAFLPSEHGLGPLSSAIRLSRRLSAYFSPPTRVKHKTRVNDDLHTRATKVLDLLQHASSLGHLDATYKLAELSLFPPSPYFPSDPSIAFKLYNTHARSTGNASSQAILAFFYATGHSGATTRDAAKAQLFYTFAAHGNSRAAQQALGYRHWAGIGTSQDCMRAMEWYSSAAEQSMAHYLSGPPGGRTLPLTATRLSDLAGGIYGPGASVASTGLNSKRSVVRAADSHAAGETWEDILEFYRYNAARGDKMYQHYLAKILYHGSLYEHLGGIGSGAEGVGAVPQDFKASHELHLDVARLFWPRDPQLDSDILKHATIAPPVKEAPVGSQYSVKACGYLGRMYMRGEGVSVDYKRARMWFERGALYGEKESLNGLGILWRDGLVDGRSNAQKAAGYFSAAASHELSEAKVNLGRLALEKGNMQKAITLFESAIHTGSPFEAYYHLGVIQRAIATQKNAPPGACPSAVSFLKVAVERGAWGAHDLMAQAEKAWSRQDEHGIRQALLLWAMAGEMGVEAAQNNVAFVLDPDVSILERALPGLAATISGTSSSSSSEASATAKEKESDSESAAAEALAQWTRASAQSNVDALVKVGDYHFFGIGLPPQTAEQTRYEKAAAFYRAAADTHLSALAMWNLGWMYEHGRGVPRDFHLAKRYYDLALETNGEAYLPVVISLAKLYVRSAWHTLNGGTEGLRLWPADEDDLGDAPGATTSKEQKKLDSTTASKDNDGQPAQDTQYEDDEDDSWYIGKARDLINQRRRRLEQQGEGTVDGIDLVEHARQRMREEEDRDADYGPEDDFDGALRAARRRADTLAQAGGDVEDAETLVFFGLVSAILVLFVVRARIMERLRREVQAVQDRRDGQDQGEQQAQGPAMPQPGQVPVPPDVADAVRRRRVVQGEDAEGGLFPDADDPEREGWVIMQ